MIKYMKTGRISLILAALVLIWMSACAQVTVKLYDVAFIAGERATLEDVAELSGNPETLTRLKSLPVSQVVKPGQTQLLTPRDIERMIPSDVAVHCCRAASVEIVTWTSSVKSTDLLPAVRRQYEALAGDSIEVFVDLDKSQKWLCDAPPPVRFSLLRNDRLFPGSQVISLECRDGSEKIRRYHLEVEIALFAQLAFPKRMIKRGQKVKSDDISLQTVNLKSTGLSGLVYHSNRLIGLEAARHLSPGSPIRWDQVRRPPAVRQGCEVKVVFDADNFLIETSAIALETGSPGDRIWVRLEDNGKRLRAVVVDADRVSLE